MNLQSRPVGYSPNTSTVQILSLKANFSWTFIGNGLYAASQWAILSVLAKLASPEIVGLFSLGFAVTAPIFLLSQLQLRSVFVTDVENEYRFGDYLSARVFLTLIAMIASAVIPLVSGYEKTAGLVIFLVALAKSIESVSDLLFGVMQKNERMDWIAKSMISKGLLSLFLLWLFLFLTGDLVYAIIGLVTGRFLLLLYEIPKVRWVIGTYKWEFTTDSKVLWSLIRLSLPLGISMLLISLNTNIPRYVLEYEFGESSLGYFSALSYVVIIGSMVVGAMGQAVTPRLSYLFVRYKQKFRILLTKLIILSIVLGIFVIIVMSLAGRKILEILYTREYSQHYQVFILIICAGAISYISSILAYALTAIRCFKPAVYLYILVLSTTLVLSLSLIPIFGLWGAAWALLASGIVQLLGNMLLIRKYSRINDYQNSIDKQ